MSENLMCPYCFGEIDQSFLNRNVYCSYNGQEKKFIHTGNPEETPGKPLLIAPQYFHSTTTRNVRVIAFTGATAHGKTVFLQSMACVLQKRDQWNYVSGFPENKYDDVFCTPLHTDSNLLNHPFFVPFEQFWTKGSVPPGTNPRERQPSVILKFHLKKLHAGMFTRMRKNYNQDVVCIFNDIAGEPAQDPKTWLEERCLVPHCKRTTDTFLIADASISDDTLADLLHKVLSAYTAAGCRTKEQNLVLILTKIDLLSPDHPVRSICLSEPFLFGKENFEEYYKVLLEVNDKLKGHISKRFKNAFNIMKTNFRKLFFTGTSSMGAAPIMYKNEMRASFDIQPIRVLDPLLFVLSEANHF